MFDLSRSQIWADSTQTEKKLKLFMLSFENSFRCFDIYLGVSSEKKRSEIPSVCSWTFYNNYCRNFSQNFRRFDRGFFQVILLIFALEFEIVSGTHPKITWEIYVYFVREFWQELLHYSYPEIPSTILQKFFLRFILEFLRKHV